MAGIGLGFLGRGLVPRLICLGPFLPANH